jgi:Conjugal transfer protein TraD.
MRKPRDYDAELKALDDKARELKMRKVQQLGELVIATGADGLTADELAGAFVALAETKDAEKREVWAKRGAAFFRKKSRRLASAPDRNADGAQTQPGSATGIRRRGRGMTCEAGRSSAVSAPGT